MSALIIAFLTVFVAGPLAFFRLIRPIPSAQQFRALAALVIVCLLVSLALRFGALGDWVMDPVLSWVSIGLVWMAWIGVLALGAQRLRQADPGKTMRRWTAILGAFGTAVPWFGLASARMMTV